jgi:hypothetical protein
MVPVAVLTRCSEDFPTFMHPDPLSTDVIGSFPNGACWKVLPIFMHPDPLSTAVYGTYPTATFRKVFQIFMYPDLLLVPNPNATLRKVPLLFMRPAPHLLLLRRLCWNISPTKNVVPLGQLSRCPFSHIHPFYSVWLAESSLRRLVITYLTVVLCTASLLILCDCSIYDFLYLSPVFRHTIYLWAQHPINQPIPQ